MATTLDKKIVSSSKMQTVLFTDDDQVQLRVG